MRGNSTHTSAPTTNKENQNNRGEEGDRQREAAALSRIAATRDEQEKGARKSRKANGSRHLVAGSLLLLLLLDGESALC